MGFISLPSDLDERALERFDDLKSKGQLFYDICDVEYIEHAGYQFEFRTTPAISKKPILSADDPGRREAIGPFAIPEPEFVLSEVGLSHTLQLSKYCVYRPCFILHTKLFVKQTVDLDYTDFEALLTVVDSLKAPQMALYNCGIEAGASQGHKHIQILPRPPPEDFRMFPDKVKLTQEPTTIHGIPFVHWVIGIPPNATADVITLQYQRALENMKQSLGENTKITTYNVVMVKQWIILIPRASKGYDGIGANGAGMMGLVWVGSKQEREGWTRLGMSKYLQYLGVPCDV